MKLGDLCRSRQVTAFYVTHHDTDHDQHCVLNPEEMLLYLGETYGDYSKVASSSSGKSGWMFKDYLEVL